MTPERWQRIEDLFQNAIDLNNKDRTAYLNAQCGANVELRREVQKLIDSAESAEDFIESPIWTDSRFLDASAKKELSDSRGNGHAGEDEDSFKGWVRVAWARPGGAELDQIGQKLKALKLSIRNAPGDQPKEFAACIFSGKPGVEEILIGRAY